MPTVTVHNEVEVAMEVADGGFVVGGEAVIDDDEILTDA